MAPLLPTALADAEIIHAHDYQSVPTRMPAVTARVLGAGTAVADHGLPSRTWAGSSTGRHGRIRQPPPVAQAYGCFVAVKAAVRVSTTGTPVASSACR